MPGHACGQKGGKSGRDQNTGEGLGKLTREGFRLNRESFEDTYFCPYQRAFNILAGLDTQAQSAVLNAVRDESFLG